jgi:hypothetical protein
LCVGNTIELIELRSTFYLIIEWSGINFKSTPDIS